MARDAAFWRWYAEVNDSIRQEVVERGWYGRETTDSTNTHDMPGMTPGFGAKPETGIYYEDEIDDRFEPEPEFVAVYGQDPEPIEADTGPDIEQEME